MLNIKLQPGGALINIAQRENTCLQVPLKLTNEHFISLLFNQTKTEVFVKAFFFFLF